ncbi:MAG: DinB family protein [Spirosoma sp.]|nr:DinB family protein [Spirosoma sp.]
MIPLHEREVWLRGPLPRIPALLQPVAHALLQAREEVNALMHDFPDELLRERLTPKSETQPVASAGFHLQHLAGVLDRMCTYARGESLTATQFNALSMESQPAGSFLTTMELVRRFSEQVDRTLEQIKTTSPKTLTEPRAVGRAQLPTTVMGLYVHAAEHTMRHVGQLSVTVRLLR